MDYAVNSLNVFLSNLFNAFRVIVLELESMTFYINNQAISFFDCVEYCAIIATALWFIKDMSYHGLFTMSKSKRDNVHAERFVKE